MVFDTLTIIGLLMVVPYTLLPLLFGRELTRVVEDSADDTSSQAVRSPDGRRCRPLTEGAEPTSYRSSC